MITKSGNTEIRNILSLQKKSKERYEQGIFIIEGVKMFSETPKDRIVKAYTTSRFFEDNKSLFKGFEYEFVTESIFEQISDTKTPQGILALVRMEKYMISDIVKGKNPFVMIIENLQDPGNLGTILRTGEGAGISGVLITKNSVDIYNPKVIRSTMGSIYRVPVVYTENLKQDMELLKHMGIEIYAAHLQGKCSYTECNYNKGTAFIIGNESRGISDEIAKTADTLIKIPMEGEVESLNAAIAATILMYETNRQRRA